jgi:hypothetical protein
MHCKSIVCPDSYYAPVLSLLVVRLKADQNEWLIRFQPVLVLNNFRLFLFLKFKQITF